MACVSEQSYTKDVELIGSAPRPPKSPHWQRTQDLCAQRFEALGYQVERQRYATGVNVIATRTGQRHPNERVILGAHYDHITGCAGADDNGSGVAGLLEVARVFSQAPIDRTLVLACWDEEENGFHGSGAHADAEAAREDRVVAALVFEMIGYRDEAEGSQRLPEGFDQVFPKAFAAIAAAGHRGNSLIIISDEPSRRVANDIVRSGASANLPVYVFEASDALKASPAAKDLRRSDHTSFWSRDIPSLMVTDTANFRNPNYHCRGGQDTVDTLDHPFATSVLRAMVGATASALLLPEDPAR